MWKKFPRNIPQKEGWYTCTVEIKNQQRYVRELYWRFNKDSVYGGKWWDNIRQDVCNTYRVYNCNNERLYTIEDCDWTYSVVAYKRRPKPYMVGFEYKSIEERMFEETLKKDLKERRFGK